MPTAAFSAVSYAIRFFYFFHFILPSHPTLLATDTMVLEASVSGAALKGDLDDDLTNLAWLQRCNLLDLIPGHEQTAQSDQAGDECPSRLAQRHSVVPPVAYDPQVHVHTKPPYSFASLIFMAIESAPDKLLPVKDIYAWIMDNFPYYRSAQSGWKNTIRHNLSLSKCFVKLDRSPRGVSDTHCHYYYCCCWCESGNRLGDQLLEIDF